MSNTEELIQIVQEMESETPAQMSVLCAALQEVMKSHEGNWSAATRVDVKRKLDRMIARITIDEKRELTCKDDAEPCPRCQNNRLSIVYHGLSRNSGQAVKCHSCGNKAPVKQNASDAVMIWNEYALAGQASFEAAIME